MIIISKLQATNGTAYDMTLVYKDTGQFKAVPKINNRPYKLQEGDRINFRLGRKPNDDKPIIDINADSNNDIILTAEMTEKLPIGNYFYDVTLYRATGHIDTFIKIPQVSGTPQHNFHVVHGE